MSDIRRGEIFYISRGNMTVGSEQNADRPGIVVSNDMGNEHSNVVEVVYLTMQPKTELPTHVTIRSTGKPSTALCEQVTTVSIDRVKGYIGQCSDKEMENIDIALMISLGLDGGAKTSKKYAETIKMQEEEITRLREQVEIVKENAGQESAKVEAIIRLETERNVYKEQCERLLERIMNGGTA